MIKLNKSICIYKIKNNYKIFQKVIILRNKTDNMSYNKEKRR